MWLYMIAAFLLFVGVVGGILTGGIFLIVFIPLGILMLISAAVYGGIGRRAQTAAGGNSTTSRADEPLPHSSEGPSGHVPTSPEALADARRVQQ
jgi:hypothetical protein